jgi:hypothetical protein
MWYVNGFVKFIERDKNENKWLMTSQLPQVCFSSPKLPSYLRVSCWHCRSVFHQGRVVWLVAQPLTPKGEPNPFSIISYYWLYI